jgi:tetracycline repressor-like protein
MVAIDSAEPDRGPAADALRRLLAASWDELARNEDIARASAAELSTDAMRRAHAAVRAAIHRLVERGRHDGAFRPDVPADWLVTSASRSFTRRRDGARRFPRLGQRPRRSRDHRDGPLRRTARVTAPGQALLRHRRIVSGTQTATSTADAWSAQPT